MVPEVGIEASCLLDLMPQLYTGRPDMTVLVLGEGLEPSRYCYHSILSRTRLPIPPPEHFS